MNEVKYISSKFTPTASSFSCPKHPAKGLPPEAKSVDVLTVTAVRCQRRAYITNFPVFSAVSVLFLFVSFLFTSFGDYTGDDITVENFFAVILGDKNAVKGGSGKVVNSKPNDRIFIYYSDHGGPGVLGMPSTPYLYGKDFVDVLRKKHASGTYKEMVIYVEACESGSVFEGLLPEDLNIYVTTASSADESSWGTYCPGMDPPPPPEYITCLGDLYSVAWLEDSESHNLKKETVEQQYQKVQFLSSSNYETYNDGSHVMEYGNKSIKPEKLSLYQGFDPATENLPSNRIGFNHRMDVIDQRDADLLFLWAKYKKLEAGTNKKAKTLQHIKNTLLHREHLDGSISFIGLVLFGPAKGPSTLKSVRDRGLPLVDDWDCLKSMVRLFETHCGSLTQYGMKHMRAFANICNNNVSEEDMEEATNQRTVPVRSAEWSPLNLRGFSA
ncbi:unnamed protein product [Fraxinus pennsylvanica]|uniref:Legumain prodomain domain-containing protein n=1 Tax=Fraxinus pennsylvanica TaxID=56036 RepID=A0AAD1ZQT7_9LAMI|nr:unnamed protein product [Fraxinus pennsylvanica]